jgi:Zn-dependent metalloprotease
MKQILSFDSFLNEGSVPEKQSHQGLQDIYNSLKPFGFTMDPVGTHSYGCPNVSKGNDYTGITIQFRQSEGGYFVSVTDKGKEKISKTIKLVAPSFDSASAVAQILKDIEPYKKMVILPPPHQG